MNVDEGTYAGRPMSPTAACHAGEGMPRNAFLVSIDEARGLLDQGRRSLAVLQALHDDVNALAEEIEHLLDGLPPEHPTVKEVADLTARTITEWQEVVSEMESHGTHVVSLDPGRLQWFGVVDARVVAFGWEEGEEDIEWYHEISEGFLQRKPLIEA